MSSPLLVTSGSRLSRPWSFNRTLDVIIPPLIMALILTGWYLCVFEIGVSYLIRYCGLLASGVFYLIATNILISASAILYVYLWSLPSANNSVCYAMPDVNMLYKPYECLDEDGKLATCSKGNCSGAWIPPRAHHCSTCGVCRLSFDHHCPWTGNCVTSAVMKPFLLLLYIAPVTIVAGASPIIRPLCTHIAKALVTSQADEWATRTWWDWAGSWIVLGGPAGRWVGGIIIGFLLIGNSEMGVERLPGDMITQPSLMILLVVGFASLLAIFAVGVAIYNTQNLLRGQTTLERLRPSKPPPSVARGLNGNHRLICVPATAEDISSGQASGSSTITNAQARHDPPRVHRRVFRVLASERLYDLGWRMNLWQLYQRPLFPDNTPRDRHNFEWPKINGSVIRRLQAVH